MFHIIHDKSTRINFNIFVGDGDKSRSVLIIKARPEFCFTGNKAMSRKEFYITAIIVVFTYLSILFQINLKNFIAAEKNPAHKVTFNLFD